MTISAFSNLLYPVANASHNVNSDGTRHTIFGKIVFNPFDRIAALERKMMKIVLNVKKKFSIS